MEIPGKGGGGTPYSGKDREATPEKATFILAVCKLKNVGIPRAGVNIRAGMNVFKRTIQLS